MPKRQSDEERILLYFRNAPLAAARVVLNLAKTEIKVRESQEQQAGSAAPQRPRAKKTAAKKAATKRTRAAAAPAGSGEQQELGIDG